MGTSLWNLVQVVFELTVLIVEAEIIKSPLVRVAIMFGRERNQTGVLIELDDSKFDTLDDIDHKKIVKQIW